MRWAIVPCGYSNPVDNLSHILFELRCLTKGFGEDLDLTCDVIKALDAEVLTDEGNLTIQ